MENKENICSKCRHFDRFYIKGVKRYNAIEYGWCCKKVGITETRDTCDNYARKVKSHNSESSIRYVLSDMLTDISEIRCILLDEDENE